MSLQVKDILSLVTIGEAKVVAGHNGLENEILQISVADNPPKEELDYVVAKKGDFYLSSLFSVKDNNDDMYEYFKVLVDTHSAGLCIIDEYTDSLPDKIIEYCNQSNYPVIFISAKVSYADIIKDVMEILILDRENKLFENQISMLLSDSITLDQKKKIINILNPHLKKDYYCIYISLNNPKEFDKFTIKKIFDLADDKSNFICEYKKGILIIHSCLNDNNKETKISIDYLLKFISDKLPSSIIGISTFQHDISNIGIAINQAMSANKFRLQKDKQMNYYNDLGILKILLPLKDAPELKAFYDEITQPIMLFDYNNQTDLLATIKVFINNNRSYKETAQKLFIHENTVRYRVNKVLDIYKTAGLSGDCLEDISIALKIKELLDN